MKRGSLRTTIFFDRASVRGKGVIDASSYILALLLFAAIAFGSWPNMIEGWEILEFASDYFWIIILTVVGGSFGSSSIKKFIKKK